MHLENLSEVNENYKQKPLKCNKLKVTAVKGANNFTSRYQSIKNLSSSMSNVQNILEWMNLLVVCFYIHGK